MRHAVEGDNSFSEANCRTEFRAGDEATLAGMVPTVSGVRTRWLVPAPFLACHIPSCAKLPHQRLHRIPCWCFLALVLVFDNRILFAETIPQFEFSALSLVKEQF